MNDRFRPEGWQARISSAEENRGALQHGIQLVEEGAPAIVGISLDNSYFSRDTLSRLFTVLDEFGSKIYIVPMDLPAEHNYRALGHTDTHIRKKIKKKGDEVRRNARSALQEVGIVSDKAKFVQWELIRESPNYRETLSYVRMMGKDCPSFSNDLDQAVDQYLGGKLPSCGDTAPAINMARGYLIEELSFLLAAHEILSEEKLCYVYHREWPIFEGLMTGAYGQVPGGNMGFLELLIEGTPR